MSIESRAVRRPTHRIALVGALFVGACQQPAPGPVLTAADERQIVASVESLTDAFEQAERDRDPERVLALIAPDFYMYADGERAEYDEIVTNIRDIASFQHFEPGWEDLEVRALGPNAALASFTFRDSIVTAQEELLLTGGATTLVWERREGEWRVVYADADHYPIE